MPEGIISDQTLTGNFSFSYNSTLPTPNRTVLAEEYFEFQMLACLVEVGFCTPFNDLFVLGSDFYNATTCERATQDVRCLTTLTESDIAQRNDTIITTQTTTDALAQQYEVTTVPWATVQTQVQSGGAFSIVLLATFHRRDGTVWQVTRGPPTPPFRRPQASTAKFTTCGSIFAVLSCAMT